MWNDTDFPIAYLITVRTKGTWLHGDAGSVSRHKNIYGTAKLPLEPKWLVTNKGRLKVGPVILDGPQRKAVREAIMDTCRHREWGLDALNVRTNHFHAVVLSGLDAPSKVLNALKANATRLLRERSLWHSQSSPWVDKGSERWLWTEQSVASAVEYVLTAQGPDLPEF